VIRIERLDDPRLDDYRAIAGPRGVACGPFIAEGRLVVRRLLTLPRFRVRSILLTDAAYDSLRDCLPGTAAPVYVGSREVMSGVVGFNIHRGCLASVERPPPLSYEALDLRSLGRVVALEGVSNPDNIGGLFRNAAAFDVDVVILGPRCGDPLYRKAVRTSMAATLMVPFTAVERWPETLRDLRSAGLRLVALTPSGTRRLHELEPWPRTALLLGAESDGLSATSLEMADACVRIAISDRVDSLNVATAAAIALYHLGSRDRSCGDSTRS
jgi:tRNA G18 (ribose-2'-O)-methylase SpoU